MSVLIRSCQFAYVCSCVVVVAAAVTEMNQIEWKPTFDMLETSHSFANFKKQRWNTCKMMASAVELGLANTNPKLKTIHQNRSCTAIYYIQMLCTLEVNRQQQKLRITLFGMIVHFIFLFFPTFLLYYFFFSIFIFYIFFSLIFILFFIYAKRIAENGAMSC